MDKYDYFDHDADIGIEGRGETLEAAFESAALAMFSVMADTKSVSYSESVEFEFEEEDYEFALVRWLNLLLAYAQIRNLVFGRFSLKRDGAKWHGCAFGKEWQKDMRRGVEVKGATLTMLSVAEEEGGWKARCIVDV